MGSKKYEIIDGNTVIATDMDLDVALCLIRGYSETYFNQKMKLTIQEVGRDDPKCE